MKIKSLLLLTLLTMLAGCAGTYHIQIEGSENNQDMTIRQINGDYTIMSPEPMEISLQEKDWVALEMSKDSQSQVVVLSRDSGKVSISISATTPQNLKSEASPTDPDSVKMRMVLEKNTQGWDTPESMILSAERGHICSSDSVENKCLFVILTKKKNWVVSEVHTPKGTSAEELGNKALEKVANGEMSEYNKYTTRFLKSYGFGMSVWYNWEDEKANPSRDFSKAFLYRKSGLIDFGHTLALSYINLFGFNYGDKWHNWGWRDMLLVGARLYAFDAFLSPFFGFHFGLGMQYDDHYSSFADKFAISLAGHLETGLVFCRYCKYQFELGASYDAVDDGFFNDQVFGSFNFYAAVNY